jgi:hypothetical protein
MSGLTAPSNSPFVPPVAVNGDSLGDSTSFSPFVSLPATIAEFLALAAPGRTCNRL